MRRAIGIFATAAWLASGPWAAASGVAHPPPPAAPADIRDANVTVDASRRVGPMLHVERYNNFGRSTAWPDQRAQDVRFLNAQGLHGTIYRVWLTEQLYDPATGKLDYAPFERYLAEASGVTDKLLVNYAAAQLVRAMTPEQMEPVLTRIFGDLKRRYPRIAYIEAFNEPDYNLAKDLPPERLYAYYQAFYRAVAAVNRTLPAGQRLSLGGPALSQLRLSWLRPFLDAYRADRSPDKRLDFISYHAYGLFEDGGGAPGQLRPYHFYKDNPGEVADLRRQVESELRARGMDPRLPSYITEMGIYPGPSNDDARDPRPDYLRQAAGTAALQYWMLGDPANRPFNWCVRHRGEERKDELVTRAGPGRPVPVDTFTPYGNMMLMMTHLGETRVAARSDALAAGKGVYAIATADSRGVAVMSWNYQGTGNRTYRTRIAIDAMPASLRNRRLRERIYLVDSRTSNWFADPDHANLQKVSEREGTGSELSRTTIALEPNAIVLKTLEPTDPRRAG